MFDFRENWLSRTNHVSSGLRLVQNPEPDTKMPESYTINVHHRYPIHEMPSHAGYSFNVPATPMDVNSSLSDYRFSSSLVDSNIPMIETCTSQKFYLHPNQSTPSPPKYYSSTQDMGQHDVQFLASSFYTHQQNSGQEMPRQIPSSQLAPLHIGEIRDQDFTNSIPDPFTFLDDPRNPRDRPLTSSVTPATLASIFDRQVHNLGIHQHSPPAPKHPQLKSIQPSNPHGYSFDDIENQWVHHNTPVGSSSGDGSRDPFDNMDAWPLQMDQNDIETWTMNPKCDNTANHPPPHKPDQNDNDNHRQQHDPSSATTPSHHDGSFPNQHQPAGEPDHVADLLTETDHHTQFPTNIDIGARCMISSSGLPSD